MPRRNKKIYSSDQLVGMQGASKVFRQLRTAHPDPGCRPYRGFTELLQKITGEKWSVGLIQQAESAGTVRDRRHNTVSTCNPQLLDLYIDLPHNLYRERLRSLYNGELSQAEPLSEVIDAVRSELGEKAFKKECKLRELTKEDVFDARSGILLDENYEAIADLLELEIPDLLECAIAQLQLKAVLPKQEESEAKEKEDELEPEAVSDKSPEDFSRLSEVVRWAISRFGMQAIVDASLEIDEETLTDLASGKIPEEFLSVIADLSAALEDLTGDSGFSAAWMLSLLGFKKQQKKSESQNAITPPVTTAKAVMK